VSQPEEAKGKTGKTDPALRGRRTPAAPGNLPQTPPTGGTEPVDPAVRAQELAHADEPAEREE
jgi:hypothetical protein